MAATETSRHSSLGSQKCGPETVESSWLEASQLVKVCLIPHVTTKVLNADFQPTVLELSLLVLRSVSSRDISWSLYSSHSPVVGVGFLLK